jgi:hypothetical protein
MGAAKTKQLEIFQTIAQQIEEAYPELGVARFPYLPPNEWADAIHKFNRFWDKNKNTLIENIYVPYEDIDTSSFGIYSFFSSIPSVDIRHFPNRTESEISLILHTNLKSLQSLLVRYLDNKLAEFDLDTCYSTMTEGLDSIEVIKLFGNIHSDSFMARCFNYLIPFWVEYKHGLFSEYSEKFLEPNLVLLELPVLIKSQRISFYCAPKETFEQFPDDRFRHYQDQFWELFFKSIGNYKTGNLIEGKKSAINNYFHFSHNYSEFTDPNNKKKYTVPAGDGIKVISFLVENAIRTNNSYVFAKDLRKTLGIKRNISSIFKFDKRNDNTWFAPEVLEILIQRRSNGQRVRLNLPDDFFAPSE